MPPNDLDFYLDPPNPRSRVHSIASKAGLTPDIADDYLKLTNVESGHNINVRNSSKGAQGFGQVMPDVKGGTTRTVGGRKYDLKDPNSNIEAGLRYFAEGGNDPVARRLYYFGGPRAKQHYEKTGKIPNISDGNMTATQYVKATGAQRQQKGDLGSYLDPPQDEKPKVSPYAKSGSYTTKLPPEQESKFQQWVRQNKVPWQDTPTADYDMRGYYQALQGGDPNAKQQLSDFDKTMHFPDTYKTPYHKTFSNESKYAQPTAPHWDGDRLVDSSGVVVADETSKGDLDTYLNPVETASQPQAPPPTPIQLGAGISANLPPRSNAVSRAMNVTAQAGKAARPRALIGMGDVQQATQIRDPSIAEVKQSEEQPKRQLSDAAYSTLKRRQLGIERTYTGAERANVAHLLKTDEQLRAQADQQADDQLATEQQHRELIASLTPEEVQQTKDIAAQLRRHGPGIRRGIDRAVQQSTSSLLYKLAGLTDIGDAVAKRTVGKSWLPEALRRKAIAGELAIDDLKDLPQPAREKIADFLTGSAVGLLEVAATPGGPVTKFAGLAGTEAMGRDKSASEVLKEAAKGATVGAMFRGAEGFAPEVGASRGAIAKAAAKQAATVGVGTTGLELATGTPLKEAAQAGLSNAVFAGGPTALRLGGRNARQAEAQREGIEAQQPTTTVPTSVVADTIQPRNAESVGGVSEVRNALPSENAPSSEPRRRFRSLQFGDVEVTDSQQGARRGRLRVAEVNDSSKIHYVKKADMQGRGNAQLLPIREPKPTTPADITRMDSARQEAAAQVERRVTPRTEQPGFMTRDIQQRLDSLGYTAEQQDAMPRKEKVRLIVEANRRGTGRVDDAEWEAMSPEMKAAVKLLRPSETAAPEVVPEIPVTKGDQSVPATEGSGQGAVIQPEPSTTSLKHAATEADRAQLDLPERTRTTRKDEQLFTDAKAANAADPTAPNRIAEAVLSGKHNLNDRETLQLDLRIQEVKNEHARLQKEIAAATDPAEIASKGAQDDALKSEFQRLYDAGDLSGTEQGRAFRARRHTIDQDMTLLPMLAEAKKDLGRDLRPEERKLIEDQAAELVKLREELEEANDRAAQANIQKSIDKVTRRGRRAETRAALDDEFADLKSQFAQARAELPRVQASGLSSLDPEGKLTSLIAKMARNRVRAGTVEAGGLVREVYEAIKEHVEGVTERDVRDAISGYGIEPRGDRRSPEAKQLADIRSQLKRLSSTEDIEGGKRLSPRDKARQTQLLKQEAEMTRRMDEGDYTPHERKPIQYTPETYKIQRRINEIKSQYERAKYRATRSTGGKILDTAVSVGSVPKTMLSMADLSALLRQGGFGYLTHPILSTKAAHDMVRSFSRRGYANVENEIKAHPSFEEAKKMGVEFTGVDNENPKLSHREEGYLGSGAIDAITKGKYNPLRPIKEVKDFSERTFVSFLDSQRMRLYDQQADAIKSMKSLTAGEKTEALKAIATQVNDMTGRGSLGHYGNNKAPILNLALFSPRLLASRVRLLNKMFNPVSWANMPKGARKQIMIENGKFLAFTALALGMARQSGLDVNLDPDDPDFLKIKGGNARYDTLTGLQQPMRFMIRMYKAMKGGETYAGDTRGKILGDFTRGKASPEVGYLWDYMEGKNRLTGKRFEAGKDLARNLIPLPFQDFSEAMKTDGRFKGAMEALPSLAGVGVQTYEQSAERPSTHAEKLARRFIINKLPDEARSQEDIDQSQQVSNIRARSRAGQDVTTDLNALKGKLTDRQVKTILGARNKTRLQEDTNRLGIEDALLVYRVATPSQRAELRDILTRKMPLIETKLPDQQQPLRQRAADLGLTAPSIRPSRSSRSERPSREARQ